MLKAECPHHTGRVPCAYTFEDATRTGIACQVRDHLRRVHGMTETGAALTSIATPVEAHAGADA